ncbi:unnamed protein product, partial [Urochloa humidicola]
LSAVDGPTVRLSPFPARAARHSIALFHYFFTSRQPDPASLSLPRLREDPSTKRRHCMSLPGCRLRWKDSSKRAASKAAGSLGLVTRGLVGVALAHRLRGCRQSEGVEDGAL